MVLNKWRAGGNTGTAQMGRLAVALARESFFGEATMGVSTLSGKGTLKALPVDGITQIHDIILSVCPAYHHNLVNFEKIVWSKRKAAINHACNSLRSQV